MGVTRLLDDLEDLQLVSPGEKVPDVELGRAITGQPVLTRTIDGASTLEIVFADHGRDLLRSEALGKRSFVVLAGINFELVQIRKAGNLLTTVYEDAIVAALRRQSDKLSIPPNASTRAKIFERLAAEPRSSITTETDPANRGKVHSATRRGGKDGAVDSWELARTLADEVRWRCFSTGRVLVAGSDEWLKNRKPALALQEFTGSVASDIDFDLDVGKRDSEATLSVDTGLFTIAPGDPVDLSDMGPADGRWLVAEVRRPLTSTRATLRLVRGKHSLKEPKREANGIDTGDPDFIPGQSGSTAGSVPGDSGARERMVQFALAQAGDSYVWGGNGPDGWDCSGLVQAATAAGGRALIKPAASQWAVCVGQGKTIPVSTALGIRGALLFRIGGTYNHVAISLGNGSTIEARGTAYGTGVFGSASSGGWTGAALWL